MLFDAHRSINHTRSSTSGRGAGFIAEARELEENTPSSNRKSEYSAASASPTGSVDHLRPRQRTEPPKPASHRTTDEHMHAHTHMHIGLKNSQDTF